MSDSGFDQAYREEFQLLQAEAMKKAAVAALRRYGDLKMSVGQFFDDISVSANWKQIRGLSLLELVQAIGARNGINTGLDAFELAEQVMVVLEKEPGVKVSVISERLQQPKKRISAILRKLRMEGFVETSGERSSMVYYPAEDTG